MKNNACRRRHVQHLGQQYQPYWDLQLAGEALLNDTWLVLTHGRVYLVTVPYLLNAFLLWNALHGRIHLFPSLFILRKIYICSRTQHFLVPLPPHSHLKWDGEKHFSGELCFDLHTTLRNSGQVILNKHKDQII